MTQEFVKFIDEFWESGADLYFTNLRKLKLFVNKISYSLPLVRDEINFRDFLAIELIRDIYPPLYEFIYIHGEYFYDPGMAFETWGKRPHSMIDDESARKSRAEFYNEFKKTVPPDKQYVFALLARLFPLYAESQAGFTFQREGETGGEKDKRIWHPRFFRQYFLFRVPPELFSQKQFNSFLSDLRLASEREAMQTFDKLFAGLMEESFKRWHFMHLIDGRLSDVPLQAARGICRGMAKNSSVWTRDAFEFNIGIRANYQTLRRIESSEDRKAFLILLIDDCSSALYALHIFWVIQDSKDVDQAVLSDVKALEPHMKDWMRAKYLVPNAPSVFDQFKSIDPVQTLFAWRRLGPDADLEEKQYLRELFTRDPASLDKLLKLMFRVEFIDDYAALKPIFDYDELSRFIEMNKGKLDPERVQQFERRLKQEQPEGKGIKMLPVSVDEPPKGPSRSEETDQPEDEEKNGQD